MLFICVVTASYTLDFSMSKNPWLGFWLKHKILKQKFFRIFIFGKNAYHTFSLYGKNACHAISYMEKTLILQFSYIYFCSMKLYERV